MATTSQSSHRVGSGSSCSWTNVVIGHLQKTESSSSRWQKEEAIAAALHSRAWFGEDMASSLQLWVFVCRDGMVNKRVFFPHRLTTMFRTWGTCINFLQKSESLRTLLLHFFPVLLLLYFFISYLTTCFALHSYLPEEDTQPFIWLLEHGVFGDPTPLQSRAVPVMGCISVSCCQSVNMSRLCYLYWCKTTRKRFLDPELSRIPWPSLSFQNSIGRGCLVDTVQKLKAWKMYVVPCLAIQACCWHQRRLGNCLSNLSRSFSWPKK